MLSYKQLHSSSLKQDIEISMTLMKYGSWTGTNVEKMSYQELKLFGSNNISLKTTFQSHYLDNNTHQHASYKIRSYAVNENYTARVFWGYNGTNETQTRSTCRISGSSILSTSFWKCANGLQTIKVDNVCDGYTNRTEDCEDQSDESFQICSISHPYFEILCYISFCTLGVLLFGLFKGLRTSCRNERSEQTSNQNETSKGDKQDKNIALTKNLIAACKKINNGNHIHNDDECFEEIVNKIYVTCTKDDEKTKVFQIMSTLNWHSAFRNSILSLADAMVNKERKSHQQKKSEMIKCIRSHNGESSYILNFAKMVVEKDSCSSTFTEMLENVMLPPSKMMSLAMKIFWIFLMAMTSLVFFYQDHVKDIMLFKLMIHVDTQILTGDVDPKTEFKSVGGLNLIVVAYYLLFVFVVSEILIYGYGIKISNRFPKTFKIGRKDLMWNLLIKIFPVHFAILEGMVVQIKLEYLRYKLGKIESDENENEEKIAVSILKIADEYDGLMKQAYHLNMMETEILAIEMTFEQLPQIVLQGAFFILMQDFKRLELLSDSSLGIELWLFLLVTWILQALSMIRNYQRCLHSKRYPITPGIVGKTIQAASIGCLIIPNMAIASATLLNAIYLHPFVYLSNAALIIFLKRSLFQKETGFGIILFTAAPVYRQLFDVNEDKKGTESYFSQIDAKLAPLLMQAVTLGVYLFTGLILRQTTFFFNLHTSKASFLKDITSNSEVLPTNWRILVAIYAGCFIMYTVLTSLYYYIGHPTKYLLKKSTI